MRGTRNKWTGDIVGTIILFLALFSILCDLFKTDIVGFIALSELIKDANLFITIVCVAYIIAIACKENNPYKSILIFVINILLINRLYSNKKWKVIYNQIRELDKKRIILVMMIVALFIYFFVMVITKRRNKMNEMLNGESFESKMQMDTSGLEHKMTRQKFDEITDGELEKDSSSDFKFSACIASILEVLLFVFSDELNFNKANGKVLSVISDNMFAFIFAYIVFFMILQIALIIFLNLFWGNKVKSKLGDEFKKSIERVETKIVKLACNLIEGCIALLDFVPDFFTTIGLLLLGQEIELKESNTQSEEKD